MSWIGLDIELDRSIGQLSALHELSGLPVFPLGQAGGLQGLEAHSHVLVHPRTLMSFSVVASKNGLFLGAREIVQR